MYIVYRLYDMADALLYVGVTDNWERRRGNHAVVQPWFPLVSRMETEAKPTRAEALDRERELIRTLAPIHNKQHQVREPVHVVDDLSFETLDNYLTGPEAAVVLGVEPATIRHAIRDGRMGGIKRGRDWYIRRDEVERYAAERQNSGKPFKDSPRAATPEEEQP